MSSSKQKIVRMADHDSRPKKVPKAVLNRLNRLLANAQAQQALAQQSANQLSEACGIALESFDYDPAEWSVNPQSGAIEPITKAAPTEPPKPADETSADG